MKILKSKKGIALENTLLFMMVIFSLCFMIASFALIGHHQGKFENIKITQKVELDQIGQYYLEYRSNLDEDKKFEEYLAKIIPEDSELSENYKKYTYSTDENSLTVMRSNNIILYVEAEIVNNQVCIKRWCYSDPTTQPE